MKKQSGKEHLGSKHSSPTHLTKYILVSWLFCNILPTKSKVRKIQRDSKIVEKRNKGTKVPRKGREVERYKTKYKDTKVRGTKIQKYRWMGVKFSHNAGTMENTLLGFRQPVTWKIKLYLRWSGWTQDIGPSGLIFLASSGSCEED